MDTEEKGLQLSVIVARELREATLAYLATDGIAERIRARKRGEDVDPRTAWIAKVREGKTTDIPLGQHSKPALVSPSKPSLEQSLVPPLVPHVPPQEPTPSEPVPEESATKRLAQRDERRRRLREEQADRAMKIIQKELLPLESISKEQKAYLKSPEIRKYYLETLERVEDIALPPLISEKCRESVAKLMTAQTTMGVAKVLGDRENRTKTFIQTKVLAEMSMYGNSEFWTKGTIMGTAIVMEPSFTRKVELCVKYMDSLYSTARDALKTSPEVIVELMEYFWRSYMYIGSLNGRRPPAYRSVAIGLVCTLQALTSISRTVASPVVLQEALSCLPEAPEGGVDYTGLWEAWPRRASFETYTQVLRRALLVVAGPRVPSPCFPHL